MSKKLDRYKDNE